ncbi:MAG: hypothetical protein V1660_00660 [archaeon]
MSNLRTAEFTNENLRSYANACMTLAWDIPQYNFDTLLIPSRGAVPIFLGMTYALKYLGKESKTHQDVLDRMAAPLTIKRGLIPNAKEGRKITDKDIKILPYPLTADINMTKYESDASNDYYSRAIRESSTKVIKSFFKEPYERIKDPYFRFFSEIINKIEKREQLALEYTTYPKINNLAMIDTVISGRASTTILNAFGEQGVYPQTFLVVDRKGEKVNKEFQYQLGYKKCDKDCEYFAYQKKMGRTIKEDINIDRRKIEFYDVNRIVTEDTGCALQGVSATLYPGIILEGNKKLFPHLSGVGAGTWHAVPRERNHRKILYHFLNTLKAAVNLQCADFCGENIESLINKEEIFEKKRKTLVGMLETAELPQINKENINSYYPEYSPENIANLYESGAQVLHIIFAKEFTDNFINNFSDSLPQNKSENKDI